MTQNKFTKYLLYAIGEIVLVVIGILIALTINNWNNERIVLNEEQLILKDLKVEMISNIEKLKEYIEYNRLSYETSNN